MHTFRRRFVVALHALTCAAVLLLPTLARAQAQATTGIIRGVVRDDRGAAVVGAAVTLLNTETNWSRAFRTSATGLYVGTPLPLGRYEVTVRAVGFEPAAQRDIVVRVGQVVETSFSIKRSATELLTVTVSEHRTTPVDASKTKNASTLTEAAVAGQRGILTGHSGARALHSAS